MNTGTWKVLKAWRRLVLEGGPGSGHFGHSGGAGGPGNPGGSTSGEGGPGGGSGSFHADFVPGRLLSGMMKASKTGPSMFMSEMVTMLFDDSVDIGDIAFEMDKDIPRGKSGKWEKQREREKKAIRDFTQKSLIKRGFPDEFVVYRGGEVNKTYPFTSVSPDMAVARRFSKYGVRAGEKSLPIYEYKVKRSDVTADIFSMRKAKSDFSGENELIVPIDKLNLTSKKQESEYVGDD